MEREKKKGKKFLECKKMWSKMWCDQKSFESELKDIRSVTEQIPTFHILLKSGLFIFKVIKQYFEPLIQRKVY